MKLPFDLGALWQRALVWYQGYSERDRRIILGILVATATSLVYIAIVEPILDYRKELGKEIAEKQEELERSMRFLGAKDSLRAEREDLRKRLAAAKARLLPGGTATLGAAALQERANALASEKGIAVQSTQMMKEEAADPFRKVAVRMTLSGELKPLAELVSAVEYGQQLNVPFIEVSRRGAVAGAKAPRTLSITVEVSGFVQGGAPAKGESPDGEPMPTVEAQADAGPGAADAAPPAAIAPSVDGTSPTTTSTVAGADASPTTSTGPAAATPPTSSSTVVGGAAGAAPPPTVVPVPPMTFPPLVVPTPGTPPTTSGAAPATVAPAVVPLPTAAPTLPRPPPGAPAAPPPPADTDGDED